MDKIDKCYAHDSRLYRYFEKDAPLEQILEFLNADAQQPPFFQYLKRWMPKTPAYIKAPLLKHIQEEEEGLHAKLLHDLMKYFGASYDFPKRIFKNKLRELNYTFSSKCVQEKSFDFFLGSFLATEYMSAKRYKQLLNAFERLNIPQDQLHFIKIHAGIDDQHSMEVKNDLIRPHLLKDDNSYSLIEEGLIDRIARSEKYLRWYENEILHL